MTKVQRIWLIFSSSLKSREKDVEIKTTDKCITGNGKFHNEKNRKRGGGGGGEEEDYRMVHLEPLPQQKLLGFPLCE